MQQCLTIFGRVQKFYCLSNFMILIIGIVWHARKSGFRRNIMRGWLRSREFWASARCFVIGNGTKFRADRPRPIRQSRCRSGGGGDLAAPRRRRGRRQNPGHGANRAGGGFCADEFPSVTDTLQQQIPGAVSIDVNGNDFAQDLRYRGFVASPIQGTPQGLAVYQNGIASTRLLAIPSIGTLSRRKQSTALTYSRIIRSSASTRSAARSACR